MQGTVNIVVSAGGLTIQGVVSRLAAGGVPPQEMALAAGNAGTLSTRTNDTDGELTLGSGHDIETGDTISIGWLDANGNLKCARLATVGTVSGTTVPFTGASGDVLPAQGYSIIADEVVDLGCDFDGDKCPLLCGQFQSGNGIAVFEDSGNAALKVFCGYTQEPLLYWDKSALTLPITGNPVDEIRLANLSSVANTFKLCGLYHSDT